MYLKILVILFGDWLEMAIKQIKKTNKLSFLVVNQLKVNINNEHCEKRK